jgi:hypothetical protein
MADRAGPIIFDQLRAAFAAVNTYIPLAGTPAHAALNTRLRRLIA